MQRQIDPTFELFSLPDSVCRALLYNEPLQGVFARQPERLMLCAHLEWRPHILDRAPSHLRAKTRVCEALSRVVLADVRAVSMSEAVLCEFAPHEQKGWCPGAFDHIERVAFLGSRPHLPEIISMIRPGKGQHDRPGHLLEGVLGEGAGGSTLREVSMCQAFTGEEHPRWFDVMLSVLSKCERLERVDLFANASSEAQAQSVMEVLRDRQEALVREERAAQDELAYWVMNETGRGVRRETSRWDVVLCGNDLLGCAHVMLHSDAVPLALLMRYKRSLWVKDVGGRHPVGVGVGVSPRPIEPGRWTRYDPSHGELRFGDVRVRIECPASFTVR